jgi:zinc transport system permease protein
MEMLQYDFMRRAFVVGLLLAVIIPCIGLVAVLRRLSMIGDALSHASLAGVAAGLLMGFNPILGAMATCCVAALGLEAVRRKIPRYSELSIAVILSAGVGLAGVLSGFASASASFNSFLFGSIVLTTDFELGLVTVVSVLALAAFLLFYKELFFVAFDERGARLAGVPVGLVNLLFTVLTAVTVSVAARAVGALVVSSMMVIPVACGMQLSKSYRGALLASVGFAVLFTLAGLTLSFYLGLRPGATVALCGTAALLVILVFRGKKA